MWWNKFLTGKVVILNKKEKKLNSGELELILVCIHKKLNFCPLIKTGMFPLFVVPPLPLCSDEQTGDFSSSKVTVTFWKGRKQLNLYPSMMSGLKHFRTFFFSSVWMFCSNLIKKQQQFWAPTYCGEEVFALINKELYVLVQPHAWNTHPVSASRLHLQHVCFIIWRPLKKKRAATQHAGAGSQTHISSDATLQLRKLVKARLHIDIIVATLTVVSTFPVCLSKLNL